MTLANEMRVSLETIIQWLRDSGLKVNESKTEICVFHRSEVRVIEIMVGLNLVKSVNEMNVLGVKFDSNLKWAPQVSATIKKSFTALHAIKLIKKYFTHKELSMLLTSNFFSILYYNSEIWHLKTLHHHLHTQIKSASANALKLCTPTYDFYMSYETLHTINKRANPNQMLMYKLAITLYKTVNDRVPQFEWLCLNFTLILTTRQTLFQTINSPRFKIGNNILNNRFSALNSKIPLEWLSLSLHSYKVKCKEMFLV